jgi:hypothetical protein
MNGWRAAPLDFDVTLDDATSAISSMFDRHQSAALQHCLGPGVVQ